MLRSFGTQALYSGPASEVLYPHAQPALLRGSGGLVQQTFSGYAAPTIKHLAVRNQAVVNI